jgi:hypothetical protein
MADALTIETRSRSRSKTPGFENGDSGKKSKKIPTISLIEEEDDVVEVPSSQSQRTKRPRRSAKAATADTSGDLSQESAKNSQKVVVSSTTTVTETVVKKVNGSEEASSTTTVTRTSNGDESQSIFNNIFNAIKTSTPILTSKKSKRITNNVSSSGPINDADHPAYKEYKEAGEYWNKYPKTDYTYSELSPHRRELNGGQVAMPNMSRKSLDKYTARVESMIHNNPLDETFLRRKYFGNTSSSFAKRSADLQYDSADEVDVSDFRLMLQERRRKNTSIVSRFFVSIVSFFSTIFYRVKSSVSGSKQSYAYTPVRQTKQGEFVGWKWGVAWVSLGDFPQTCLIPRNLINFPLPNRSRVILPRLHQALLPPRLQQSLRFPLDDPLPRHLAPLHPLGQRRREPQTQALPPAAAHPVAAPVVRW